MPKRPRKNSILATIGDPKGEGDGREDDDDLDNDEEQERAALRFAGDNDYQIGNNDLLTQQQRRRTSTHAAAASEGKEAEEVKEGQNSSSSRWRRGMASFIITLRHGMRTYLTMDQDLDDEEGGGGGGGSLSATTAEKKMKEEAAKKMNKTPQICSICMEDGKARICCPSTYCDYCYGMYVCI